MRAFARAVAIVVCLDTAAFAQVEVGEPVAPPAQSPAQTRQTPAATELDLATVLGEQRDAFGRRCEVQAVYTHGDLRFVACGDAGVWVVRVHESAPPLTLERREVDGHARGFFVQGGALWVQITSMHARPLVPLEGERGVLAPQAAAPALEPHAPRAASAPQATQLPAQAAQQPEAERPPRDASVVAVESGHVTVDLGAREVREGDHVALYTQVRDPVSSGVRMLRDELIAVGKVVSVGATHARVLLGVNERVPVGATARVSSRPLTASSVAPPRVADVWEIGFLARPFLVLDNLGAGLFADLRAGYRAASGLHYELLLQPVGIGTAEQGATTPAAAAVAIGYDATLIEVGLGVGGQTVNEPDFDLEPGTGITLLQRVRIGARDGLHLEAFSYVALFHSEFEFSSLRVQGQIPMSRGTWLLVAGSGGSLGLGHGEVGVRILLSGNGDADSFFLTTTVGGVHVFETEPCFGPFDACDADIDYTGPLVGVGGEWRL